MGGRGAVVAQAGGAKAIVQENYEDSFREGAKTARFGIGAVAVGNAISNVADAATALNTTNKATETTLGLAAQQTNQAQIAADVTKATISATAP